MVEESVMVYLSRELRCKRFGDLLDRTSCAGKAMCSDMHRSICTYRSTEVSTDYQGLKLINGTDLHQSLFLACILPLL